MNITIKDIIKICNAKLIYGNEEFECTDFSKDTRTIKDGDVYIGIKGENFDGNKLYKEAFEKGASVCIVQNINIEENEYEKYKNKNLIVVEDTIEALQKIAKYKRELYKIPVIAVTGSVGKTSTKDIIASVVGVKYNVLKTQGNLNNHIGLPLTILGLKEHNALVVEMGMNNLGEISTLSKIAKPNIAVITNVGTAHIGNLGSRENILKAKLEILDGMDENGVLIINNDNDMLQSWNCSNKKINVITYGIENNSNVKAINIDLQESASSFDVEYNINNSKVSIENVIVPIGGTHFVYNALCAVAIGKKLNISNEEIKNGINNFVLSKNRMEIINLKNDILLINDCYNANYDSMKAGIEYLAKTKANKKIAVLGDMLELGEFSYELHKKVGEEIIKNNIDILVTVGQMAEVIYNTVKEKNTNVYMCENNCKAIETLKSIIHNKDIIYVKASNGMRFKEIIDGLMELK
ncbi:MAG: UDP-N-acetylmuramoyl-tripeptide--D-alanyl-D-alanine ligase [Clostridiales bacterium]|nr:UDP-N-acetylmuramoyl-tripeptide--D-alanyl-D-alanine ligase [Clostridiales bacterium]